MKKYHLIGAALAILAIAACMPAWGESAGGRGASGGKGVYKVKKGDTLWEISRGQFGDPFDWPLIWKGNSGVKNPDRIYPGQTIIIPVVPAAENKNTGIAAPETAQAPAAPAVPETAKAKPAPLAKTPKPVETAATPAEREYLFTGRQILSSGFITRKDPAAGMVLIRAGGPALMGPGDKLYIEISGSANPGKKFLIARISEVDDPVTGKFAGYLVEPHGIALAEGGPINQGQKKKAGPTTYQAEVSTVFQGIMAGDAIVEYKKPEKVLLGTERKPQVGGYLLALKNQALIEAQMNAVYLNKGSRDGLKTGDILQTMSGPDKNAIIQIISTGPDFATACVKQVRSVVRPGDKFTGVK